MNESFAYTGRELETMDEANNYHRWILGIFQPYLGNHVVEVGAGLGAFSELILTRHPCKRLSLVEPSASLYEQLLTRTNLLSTTTKVTVAHGTFAEFASQLKSDEAPDSIIYVNVLEHIEDDEAELAVIRESLNRGGHALFFVPALRWLYGKFDQRVGHFRRYGKRELEEILKRADFRIVRSTYFDLPGVLPWWIKYRVLRSETMGRGAVRFYDRFVVPAVRLVETRVSPPIGKNVIVIAQKG